MDNQPVWKSKTVIFTIFILILLTAFLFRFAGFTREPASYHPDEYIIVEKVLAKVTGYQEGAELKIYMWPGITISNFFIIFFTLLKWVGVDVTYILVLKTLQFSSILFGTASVAAVFFLAQRMYDTMTGLLASGFFALMMDPIRIAHWATTDSASIFFMIICFHFCYQLMKSREHPHEEKWIKWNGKIINLQFPKTYLLIAVFFTLTVLTKWIGLTLLFPIAYALCYRHGLFSDLQQKRIQLATCQAILKSSFIIGVVSILTSILIWPKLLVILDTVWGYFKYNSLLHKAGHYGIFATNNLNLLDFEAYTATVLYWGMGIALMIACLLGILFLLQRHKPEDLFLVAFILVYLLFMGSYKVRLIRYFIPVFPLLAIAAAVAITSLYASAKKAILRIVVVLVVILIISHSFIYALAYTNILVEEDVRVTAEKWIDQNIPAGKSVIYAPTTQPWAAPRIDSSKHVWSQEAPPDYVVMTRSAYDMIVKYIQAPEKYVDSDFFRGDFRNKETLGFYQLVYFGEDENSPYKLAKSITKSPHALGFFIDDTNAPYDVWSITHPEIRIYQFRNSTPETTLQ